MDGVIVFLSGCLIGWGILRLCRFAAGAVKGRCGRGCGNCPANCGRESFPPCESGKKGV